MPFVYTSMPSTKCSQCIQTAVIQEALFNRIYMLEKQLQQASKDKDAAYRTLCIRSTTRTNSETTSGSSITYVDPTCSSPGGSSLSFAASSAPPHLSASQTPDKQQLPLIDLLGPIEQDPEPCFESPRLSFNPGVMHTDVQDSVEQAHSISPMSKSDSKYGNAENVAYIRHFSGKLQDPTLVAKETACLVAVPQPENEIGGARISDHKFFSPYSSSNDADSERRSPDSGNASLNSSFTESQGSLDPTQNAIPKISGRLPLPKLDRSQWVHSNALKALLVALSSEERWEEYCQNITAKISGGLGDTCIEQEAFQTVMIYNVPADCTMGNILDRVRGGMILDAKLLDTTTITGSNTAMLTFVESTAAVSFTEHVSRYGLSISGCVVRAFLIEIPTARIKLGQIRAINSHFHSRCLKIHNFPLCVTLEELRCDLQPHKATNIDLIERMSINTDGLLELRFLSVTAAEDAFSFLTLRGVKAKYWQCLVVYGADPCAEPWAVEDSAAKNAELTTVNNTNTHQSTSANLGRKAKSKETTRNNNAIGAVENTVV